MNSALKIIRIAISSNADAKPAQYMWICFNPLAIMSSKLPEYLTAFQSPPLPSGGIAKDDFVASIILPVLEKQGRRP